MTKILDIGGQPVRPDLHLPAESLSDSSSSSSSSSSASSSEEKKDEGKEKKGKKGSAKSKAKAKGKSKAEEAHDDGSSALWEGAEGVEIPPIPAHIHSGQCVHGRIVGPGKKEVADSHMIPLVIGNCCT